MKTSQILGIAFAVIAVVVLFFSSRESTKFVSFQNAIDAPEKKHKINGTLVKSIPLEYDPLKDPNRFVFHMKDKENGKVEKVVYKGAKPQGFERSEEIVLTASYDGNEIVAEDILLKCPSKYKEDETFIRERSEG